ncbi:biotin-dependent carboxyltransferase family protein [Lacrimispora sp. JR3]|uniref:5-oxoprolinase subunit C family protein n=1 Tax=Lacrimispora sinapis TaxID=3111456 RepID=UPI00374A132E
MALEIVLSGPLSTIQDIGRRGYQSQGFQENGACDKYSMKLANLLAGNLTEYDQAAVIEFTYSGGEIRFTSQEIFALTGADMNPSLNGRPVPMYGPVIANPGDILSFGFATSGLRTYLAVYGGICVPPIMGSRSTNLKCRIGGFEGSPLRTGAILSAGKTKEQVRLLMESIKGREEECSIKQEKPWLKRTFSPWRFYGNERFVLLRAVEGPQAEAFTEEGKKTFVRNPYRLLKDCDRMACRLEGPPIEMVNGADIISDGIAEGSVQVSASGLPMVMMADHQTTGGYAKIATVISADIPALAQLRPGDSAAFKFVTPEEGVAACRLEERKLLSLKKRLWDTIYELTKT